MRVATLLLTALSGVAVVKGAPTLKADLLIITPDRELRVGEISAYGGGKTWGGNVEGEPRTVTSISFNSPLLQGSGLEPYLEAMLRTLHTIGVERLPQGDRAPLQVRETFKVAPYVEGRLYPPNDYIFWRNDAIIHLVQVHCWEDYENWPSDDKDAPTDTVNAHHTPSYNSHLLPKSATPLKIGETATEDESDDEGSDDEGSIDDDIGMEDISDDDSGYGNGIDEGSGDEDIGMEDIGDEGSDDEGIGMEDIGDESSGDEHGGGV